MGLSKPLTAHIGQATRRGASKCVPFDSVTAHLQISVSSESISLSGCRQYMVREETGSARSIGAGIQQNPRGAGAAPTLSANNER